MTTQDNAQTPANSSEFSEGVGAGENLQPKPVKVEKTEKEEKAGKVKETPSESKKEEPKAKPKAGEHVMLTTVKAGGDYYRKGEAYALNDSLVKLFKAEGFIA